MRRMDGELRTRSLDGVGGVEVCVADEIVVVVQEVVACGRVAAVAEVQHHVLGQRANFVFCGDVVYECPDRGSLGMSEAVASLERRHPPNVRPTASGASAGSGVTCWETNCEAR